MNITKVYSKDFNHALLMLEFKVALGENRVPGVLWSGYVEADRRVMTPAAERRVVASKADRNGITETWADPGEINLQVPDDYSGAEVSTMESVLDNHDSNGTTPEQDRQDQDELDRAELRLAYEGGPTLLTADQAHKLLRMVLRTRWKESI